VFFQLLAAIIAGEAIRSHREEQEREAWVKAWERAMTAAPARGSQLPPAWWAKAPERPW
jgi:hypothetical protein